MSGNDLPFSPARRTFPHDARQVNGAVFSRTSALAVRRKRSHEAEEVAKGYTEINVPLGKSKE
jgi:hypothetical protein